MEAIYFSARVKCGMVLDLFLLPCTTPSLSKYLWTAFYQSKNTDDAEKRIDTLLYFLYLPYILWLSFAAFLNASIVFLN